MAFVRIVLVSVIVLLQFVVPGELRAGAPTDQVRQTADQVLTLLQDGRFKGADKESQRRDRLRQIIGNRFDFPEMAKRSLGANWRRISAAEQGRFVELFTELLEKSYADQIESYDGEKIVYGREKVARDQAEVDSKIITKKGSQVTLDYKLRSAAGDWKVYDVVIENVSLVNNYRAQFNRILAKSTFGELLRRLEAKSPELQDART